LTISSTVITANKFISATAGLSVSAGLTVSGGNINASAAVNADSLSATILNLSDYGSASHVVKNPVLMLISINKHSI
jgi:hypothetical protein